MSPRRKIPSGEQPLFVVPAVGHVVRWRLLAATALMTLVAIAAVTVCALMLFSHESQRRTARNEIAVLDVAEAFTAEFLSPNPSGDNGTNRYVDRMTAQTTGEFGRWWRDRRSEILIQIATGPEVSAQVLAAAVERWNDDGSADVLVVAKTSVKGADGKVVSEPTYRCVTTVKQEGDQWKISNLSPVL